MGKRISLAALADDSFYTEPARPASATPVDATTTPPETLGSHRIVPITDVAPNPLNKRPPGQDDEIAAMAETIRAYGVIQPLVVCSTGAYLADFPAQREALADTKWVALIGNRRLLAARMAARDEVEVLINDDQVTSMYEVMLVENGQRRELPPLLEAEAMAEVLKATSISQRELARRIGKSHVYITYRLALLKLIPGLRELLEQEALTIEQGREFGELPELEQRAIYLAGKPYKRRSGNAVNTRPANRSIRVTSPASAAESIRTKFTTDELAELVRLLSAHLDSKPVPPR
jgi:ParB family transcriptional regulator, chromosome partitioning protein